MKTLFASIAFFLYADFSFLTTIVAPNSTKENTPLTLTELMEFRNEPPQTIGNSLTKRDWINTTQENIKNETIEKEQSSWERLSELGFSHERLFYIPIVEADANFDGPSIRYITILEEEFTDMIKQASADTKNFKRCKDSEHNAIVKHNEIHFSSKDCNIIFNQRNMNGIFMGSAIISGRKK